MRIWMVILFLTSATAHAGTLMQNAQRPTMERIAQIIVSLHNTTPLQPVERMGLYAELQNEADALTSVPPKIVDNDWYTRAALVLSAPAHPLTDQSALWAIYQHRCKPANRRHNVDLNVAMARVNELLSNVPEELRVLKEPANKHQIYLPQHDVVDMQPNILAHLAAALLDPANGTVHIQGFNIREIPAYKQQADSLATMLLNQTEPPGMVWFLKVHFLGLITSTTALELRRLQAGNPFHGFKNAHDMIVAHLKETCGYYDALSKVTAGVQIDVKTITPQFIGTLFRKEIANWSQLLYASAYALSQAPPDRGWFLASRLILEVGGKLDLRLALLLDNVYRFRSSCSRTDFWATPQAFDTDYTSYYAQFEGRKPQAAPPKPLGPVSAGVAKHQQSNAENILKLAEELVLNLSDAKRIAEIRQELQRIITQLLLQDAKANDRAWFESVEALRFVPGLTTALFELQEILLQQQRLINPGFANQLQRKITNLVRWHPELANHPQQQLPERNVTAPIEATERAKKLAALIGPGVYDVLSSRTGSKLLTLGPGNNVHLLDLARHSRISIEPQSPARFDSFHFSHDDSHILINNLGGSRLCDAGTGAITPGSFDPADYTSTSEQMLVELDRIKILQEWFKIRNAHAIRIIQTPTGEEFLFVRYVDGRTALLDIPTP